MKQSKFESDAVYLDKLNELTKLTQNPEKVSHISPMGEPVTSHPTQGGYVIDKVADIDPGIEALGRIGIEELEEPEKFVAIDPKAGGGYGKVEEDNEGEFVVTIIEAEPETEDTVENRQMNKIGDTVTIDKDDIIPLSKNDIDDLVGDDVSYESRDSFDEALSDVYRDLHGS